MAQLSFAGSPHGGSQKHLPEWQNSPRITPTTIIDHSIVGSGAGAFAMFRDTSSLESHFIVLGRRSGSNDGHIWQLVDTNHEADANLNANRYALSIETEDDGDPDRQPWTAAQLRSLAWLHDELRRVHPTIPRRESRSCSDPGGLGYHTLHGAPSCWTPVSKSCPGTVRRTQWRATLLPAFLTGTQQQEAWWMADEIPASELQKIEAQAVQALQSGPGQAAITQGVIAALSYRPPAISENHKALTITELLGVYSSAGYPAIMRNQAAGLANQAAARAALDALEVTPGGERDPLSAEQVTAVADAIAASLKGSLAPDIVNALAEALID